MKAILALLTFISSSLVASSLHVPAQAEQKLVHSPADQHEIMIHNRPLARVNGKTISLYDVVGKMNMFLHLRHPEVFKDKPTLCQFYLAQWKIFLEDMVNNELILADAEDKEVDISEGDIRKKLEEDYGSHLFAKLDEMGLSLEEVKKSVKEELTIQQMMWFRAYSRALQNVTPGQIKRQYETEKAQFKSKDTFTYQMLTIRGNSVDAIEKIAKEAYALLEKQNTLAPEAAVTGEEPATIAEVAALLNQKCEESKLDVKLIPSLDYSMDSAQIAAQHMEVLSNLPLKTFSKPVLQTSKTGDVIRIFYLKDREKTTPHPFTQLAASLKDKLTEFYANREKKNYIDRLKKQYRAEDHETYFELPKDYTPFDLF